VAKPSIALKREIVKALVAEYGSVTAMCRLVGLSESSYYYEEKGRAERLTDERVLKQLVKLAGQHTAFGYRRLAKLLRRRKGYGKVNRKRVQRVLREAGIQAKKARKRVFTTDSTHGYRRYPNLVRGLVIDHPNQVWCCDITYIVLASGEVVYLAIVLDVFTRRIRGWELGRAITSELTTLALQRAFKRGTPQIHHTDQGVQYATPMYTQWLEQRGVQISMTDRGAAWQNGYAERWMRTLKEEEVYLSEYETYEDARKQIGKFIDAVYNQKRIHSALGDLSPTQFEAQWRAQQKMQQTLS
jgi:putative transposase